MQIIGEIFQVLQQVENARDVNIQQLNNGIINNKKRVLTMNSKEVPGWVNSETKQRIEDGESVILIEYFNDAEENTKNYMDSLIDTYHDKIKWNQDEIETSERRIKKVDQKIGQLKGGLDFHQDKIDELKRSKEGYHVNISNLKYEIKTDLTPMLAELYYIKHQILAL